jgi:apolipoprotein N-acyltransferase
VISGAARWRARVIALHAGLGVVAAAGQAPLGWWWLSLLALCAIMAALPAQAGPRLWAGRMWLAGLGYFAASLFWIVEPFFIEPEIHGWMAPFALVLMAGGMALFWGLAGGLAAWLAPGRARLVALAVLMVGAELLRGWVFTGFPWAMLGHGLIGTPLMQLAAITGAGGLSLLLLLCAALPVLGANAVQRGAGAVLAGLVLAFGWGWGLTQQALPEDRGGIVRLAQPNAPQAEKWLEENIYLFFYRLLEQTSASPVLASSPPPDLVLWPETAVPFLLEYPGDGLAMMADALAAQNTEARLGFGVQRLEDGRFFNSFAVLTPQAEVTHLYDKHHLVPFGEYIPFSEWLLGTPIGGLAGRALSGYTAGPGPVVLDLGDLGLVLPLICYESIFPRHLRATPRPDWVVQVTNDAWFGALTGPYQHLAQARLRAVEQGLPVLRVANTGVSAFIDARGGIVAELALNTAGVLDGPVPGALPPTVYARHGDWPLVLGLGVLLLGAGLIRRRYSAS